MEDFALYVLTTTSLSVLLSGFLIWVTKTWISERLASAIRNEYDQKLETHKAQLKAQSDVEVEKLKAQLSIASTEHQVRFSKLHDKRAEVIGTLYALLVQAYWDGSSFSSIVEFGGEPDKKQKYAAAMNSSAEFFRFFDKNRIYLPEALCKQVEDFVTAMRQKVVGFGVYLHRDDDQLGQAALIKKHDSWSAAWEFFEKEVPIMRAALDSELRKILNPA